MHAPCHHQGGPQSTCIYSPTVRSTWTISCRRCDKSRPWQVVRANYSSRRPRRKRVYQGHVINMLRCCMGILCCALLCCRHSCRLFARCGFYRCSSSCVGACVIVPVHTADTRLAAIVLELCRGVSHIWVTQDSPGGFEWRFPCADHVAAQPSDHETLMLRAHLARRLHLALLPQARHQVLPCSHRT